MATTVKTDLMQAYQSYVTVDSSVVLNAKNMTIDHGRSSNDQNYLGSDSTYTTLGSDAWTSSLESDQVLTQDVSAGIEVTYIDLLKIYNAKTQVTITCLPDHTDISSGQEYEEGTAVIDGLSWNMASGEAPASWSAKFKGIGATTIKTTS